MWVMRIVKIYSPVCESKRLIEMKLLGINFKILCFKIYSTNIAILNELWKNGEEEIKAKTWKN